MYKMTVKEYNQCVRRFGDDLYRFALRYCTINVAAEDAVQDVFVALWSVRGNIDAKTAKGWLIRVLYRHLIDEHRHEQTMRRAITDTDEEYRQHDSFEIRDAMSRALSELPEQQRALVLLRDLEGYDYAEMANLTGLSEQQVGVYLWRARKTLKKLLEDYR